MSVLIKGMKMPKSCIECYFSGFTKGKGTVCLIDGTRLIALLDENMAAKYIRASVCPLIHIPDHGDLIDESETVEAQYYDDEHEEWSSRQRGAKND